MTKQYEVTGAKIVFGSGFVLSLAEQQAQSRQSCLQKMKNGLYRVIKPVEFKRGEVIGIHDGSVSKTMVAGLEETGKKKTASSSPAPLSPALRHHAFGKYDVVDTEGVVLTEKPLPKAEAQAFLDKLTKGK